MLTLAFKQVDFEAKRAGEVLSRFSWVLHSQHLLSIRHCVEGFGAGRPRDDHDHLRECICVSAHQPSRRQTCPLGKLQPLLPRLPTQYECLKMMEERGLLTFFPFQ